MSRDQYETLNRAGVSLPGRPVSDSQQKRRKRHDDRHRPGGGPLPPAAQFDEDGNLEIRASAAGNCRRALWYSATGYEPTNPPSEKSLTAMEAGNALEPVVLRAMERAGVRWFVEGDIKGASTTSTT